MTITESGWTGYIDRLAAINNTAAKKFVAFLNTHETATGEGRKLALDYAAALVQKYGESAAAVACEMYDAVAEASGVMLPAAEPAAVATYGEVARTVNGIMKQSDNPEYIGSGVSRLVKQAGVDTTVKNAIRDGAEWAWIPHGDTCSFCIMLASNGWQKASKKVMKGDHAEHVHANCDCTFAIRFDRRSSVAGYDPDRYREIYDSGEGDTWKEKLNSMRRDDYAANADKIRAQKRAAYERQRNNRLAGARSVDQKTIDSENYRMKFRGITGNAIVDDAISHNARKILRHRSGTGMEDLVLLDADTGAVIYKLDSGTMEGGVSYDEAITKAIDRAHERGRKIVAIHNHPDSLPPTLDDAVSMRSHGYDYGVVVAHDGTVYDFTKAAANFDVEFCNRVHNNIAYQLKTGGQIEDVWYNILKEYGVEIRRR